MQSGRGNLSSFAHHSAPSPLVILSPSLHVILKEPFAFVILREPLAAVILSVAKNLTRLRVSPATEESPIEPQKVLLSLIGFDMLTLVKASFGRGEDKNNGSQIRRYYLR